MSANPEICYLIAIPDVAQVENPGGLIRGLKDEPYFQAVDIDTQTLSHESFRLNGVNVSVLRQRFDGRIQVMECRFSLESPLSQASIQARQNLQAALQERLIPQNILASGQYEEYIILLIQETDGTPDDYIKKHDQNLARFIRSQRESFDELQLAEILVSRVRYSREDMTLVDWEGAIIFAPAGDFQSDIELLKVGNYQLLRYRILDQSIEESLRTIGHEFITKNRGLLGLGPTRNSLRRIINLRLELMLDFEHTSQNLLLIGDWYTAKLYHVIQDELYLANWRENVQSKLETLEDITHTIQENFSLTWRGLMEQVELGGWILLLIGYFVLFYLDWVAAH